VIKAARDFIGATNPLNSAPGTIRGDYGVDVGRYAPPPLFPHSLPAHSFSPFFHFSNIIHGSDTNEGSATREIALWFKPEEVIDWKPTQNVHIYEKN
jgi:nucleoside-diphosphate kinase